MLLAMQGLGKSGVHQVKMIEWGLFGDQKVYPMPRSITLPSVMAAHQGGYAVKFEEQGWQVAGEAFEEQHGRAALPKQIIPKDLIPEAILNPPISWFGTTLLIEPVEDQFRKYKYPESGCPEIHMIWTDTPSWITCWNDGNSYIKALRSSKIEFILAQHPWLENDCLLADIILPSNTKFEEKDIAVDHFSGQFHTIMHEEQCIEALGESKSDYEIVVAIAEKMGLLNEYTEGRSIEDWRKIGFDSSGVQNRVTYEELKEKGYFVLPTDPEWEKYRAGMIDFYEDPENNPLQTPSGKIEFYSRNLAKYFPNDQERPPVPHWIEKGESHDERLSSYRSKEYPLLVMSNHGRWRVHSQHDDINWFHEIPTCKVRGSDCYLYEPIWINPIDARKRGIKDGDIVKVFNERGAVLVGARVWERIMPGVVYVDHGSRYDPIILGELDRGGAINSISPHKTTSKNATGIATSGYLAEVELLNLDELRKRYPEAFNRPYDKASGLRFERVFTKGKK